MKRRALVLMVAVVLGNQIGFTADFSRYFPRTATVGQDGTAAHPYEIADADGLKALAAAVATFADARSLCYRQTADIDMSDAEPFAGIGTRTNSSGRSEGNVKM